MSNKAVLPEDIIADGADHTVINGTKVRKGSVAAFIANIEILQNPNSSTEDKDNALQAMKELAPAIVTVGLHHHVTFKNKQAEAIIQQAAKSQLV
ncbi:hypothetical protein [Legionella micdadei]|uniref:hypothetical protein n=1 Tax=Legionella micdadei TaxID=451 RepID=UPI0009EF7CB7|nr:hypothetical protein [Legionella micdadei]ARG99850.1 hypothetical protein B6V88_05160 [Legionella micdadei]